MSRRALVIVAAGLSAGLAAGCGINTRDAGKPTGVSPGGGATSTTSIPGRAKPAPNLPKRPNGVVAIDGQRERSLTGTALRGGIGDGFTPRLSATGEAQGFRDLCSGRVDVIESSRPIGPREQRLCQRNGVDVADPIEVAADAVVIATRNESDVGGDCLQQSTVREIFRAGSPIESWDQVGFDSVGLRTTGPDQDTTLFQFFAAEVLDELESPSLADVRSDYHVHRNDDAVREEVTNEARLRTVRLRYAPRIARLERQERRRLAHEIAVAVAAAKARALASIAAQNQHRAALGTILTSEQKRRIGRSNRAFVERLQNQARDNVLAHHSTPELTHLRRVYRDRLARATVHGTVGIFRFSYYELYEHKLRPMEIWDPATARAGLDNAGVAVTPPPGSGEPTPRGRDGEPVVNPDTTPWCVFPSQLTITNGSYPLSRPIWLFVSWQSLKRPEVRAFLGSYLARAQQLARDNRLVAITDDLRQRQLAVVNGAAATGGRTSTTATAAAGAETSLPAAATPGQVAGVGSGGTPATGTTQTATTTATTTQTQTTTTP